mgnify:CR=1 FL=1
MELNSNSIIGIIGAGAMGSGIAQVAASAGHQVYVYDLDAKTLELSKEKLEVQLHKLQEKGKIFDAPEIINRLQFVSSLEKLQTCNLIIEAIVENLSIKQQVFASLEAIVSEDCILASNTSSLSITSIAAACQKANRVIGIHFFNPAPLMALVEIIPAIQTETSLSESIKTLLLKWGKIPVIVKDTPGFIVNRVARPFYGEALKIYEEGIADIATIDWALTHIGGFKMGPFTLMDFIGHDVNYIVTETVFKEFYFDNRYKPSLSQKRLLEARWLGKKSGRGFYDYAADASKPTANEDLMLGKQIVDRVVLMLINEAIDALYLKIASKEDIDLAMTKGVNYPKGLLIWAEEIGLQHVLEGLDALYNTYLDERYRASVLLRKLVAAGEVTF